MNLEVFEFMVAQRSLLAFLMPNRMYSLQAHKITPVAPWNILGYRKFARGSTMVKEYQKNE